MSNFFALQMRFISDVGDKTFLLPAFGAVSVVYLYLSGYKKQAFLLAATALSALLSYGLKMVFKQPRPITSSPNFSFDMYSFPSNHTFAYTVFFGYLAYMLATMPGVPTFYRTIGLLISIYFLVFVGVSRVYLGQHYVWDVLGGYFFGLLFLSGIIFLDKRL